MAFYSFQELYKVFKEKYKQTFFILLFLFSLCIYANKTFLSEKLERKYSVSFDYEYNYQWVNITNLSIEYDKHIYGIACDPVIHIKANCMAFPYNKLEMLISNFFESIYNHSMNDIKPEGTSSDNYSDYKDKYYDIALAFSYDDLNHRYRNKKLHIGWSNVQEAQEYLQSLHDRATDDLVKIIKSVIEENNFRIKKYYGNKILTFPPTDIGRRIKEHHNLTNDLELEKFVEDTINKFRLNDINDIDLIRLIFQEALFYPGSMDTFIFHSTLGSYEEFSNMVSTKRDIIYYYLGNKFRTARQIKNAELNFFPNSKSLFTNIEKFLPKYKIKVAEVNPLYIYLIEILLSFLVTIVIILTLSFGKRNN
tara:strand:- start:903 stop:1997 length:1095 start_codon:yes stop_codon:yes gene_type:complete